MKIYGLIIAKGDSKRLPNKNILNFNEKPMIQWNLDKCLKIFDKTYVSSENPEILRLAELLGAIPIKRPKRLCGDTPNIPVYQHAVKKMGKVDAIVAVQANSPTIETQLIKTAKYSLIKGSKEVKTCHKNGEHYGSIWGMTIDKLNNYNNPYVSLPESLITDESIDIHTKNDYSRARSQPQR